MYAQIAYVEGAVVLVIAVLIFKLGIETTVTSVMILMDANLDESLQKEIEEKLNGIYGVKGVSDVRIRQSGPFKMVECVIKTNPSLPLYKTHGIADQAEEMMFKAYDSVESVFVHVEPDKTQATRAVIPVSDKMGLDSKVHGHFGRAPLFLVATLNRHDTEVEGYYENDYLTEKGHIGLKVVKKIADYRADLLFAANVGEISFHMLKNSFVDIYQVEKGAVVSDIIDNYRLEKLTPISELTHTIEESQVKRAGTENG